MNEDNPSRKTSESIREPTSDSTSMSPQELAIYQLLESRWDDVRSRVAMRVTRTVVWNRRIEKATWCVAATIGLMTVQIGIDFTYLSRLEAARGKLAVALRASVEDVSSSWSFSTPDRPSRLSSPDLDSKL